MESTTVWEPNIENWDGIKPEAYQVIYELAKERFADLASESESITNKAIRMILAVGGITSFVITSILKNIPSTPLLIAIGSVLLIEFYLLYILIAPKRTFLRGLPPDVSMPENFGSKTNQECQLQVAYYTAICLLQTNIDEMLLIQVSRSKKYRIAFILLLAVAFLAAVLVGLNYDHL